MVALQHDKNSPNHLYQIFYFSILLNIKNAHQYNQFADPKSIGLADTQNQMQHRLHTPYHE